MPKKLIVCCDGTWNDDDSADGQTNVAKLRRLLQNSFVEEVNQLVFYVSGVGTQPGQRIRGGAFGAGINANILEAYRLLVEHYEEDSLLYLFGFSRGAYTARSLAGFIRNSGLLKQEHAEQIDNAFTLYRDRSEESGPNSPAAQEFRAKYSHAPEIEFIGVWDTVGSLGIPVARWKLFGWLGKWVDEKYRFHDENLSSIVRHAYHAMSIHERRGTFPVTLWQKQAHSTEQVLEQVWFPGVHSDVGGGYRSAGLSDAALDWMIEKARACGLKFREDALKPGVALAADPLGKMHDSYRWSFKLIDFLNGMFGGMPRAFNTDPSSCESVSNIAQDRFRLNKDEVWPNTFLNELQHAVVKEAAKVHNIHP